MNFFKRKEKVESSPLSAPKQEEFSQWPPKTINLDEASSIPLPDPDMPALIPDPTQAHSINLDSGHGPNRSAETSGFGVNLDFLVRKKKKYQLNLMNCVVKRSIHSLILI